MFNLSDNLAIYSEQDYTALDLAEKKIVAKQFDNCCFNSCNFSKVEFKNCKFTECKFIDCNLSSIGLKDCFFFEVVFEGLKTIAINGPQAWWPHIKLPIPIHF